MNRKQIYEIIKNLASVRSPSGLEHTRGELFKSELDKILVNKNIEIRHDALNNYFIKFSGKNSKKIIAILAHMDEIGGTIRKIKKKGTLEFSKRGGYEGRWLISRKISILNKEGKWINGVIGGRAPHATPQKLRGEEKDEPLEMEIYIGAKDKEEAIDTYQIHIGAPFVFSGEFELLNEGFNDNIISGYSMDDLVGLTGLVLLANKISENLLDDSGNLTLPLDLYIVGTAREEIGTEGSLFFTRNNLIDEIIALDVGLVESFPGTVSSDIKLNDGPVIVWQEAGGTGVFNYQICKTLVEVAKRNNIKYQDGVLEFYGSDAGKAQKWLGIPSALVGIPSMFSHNVPEISTLDGIEEAVELIFQYLKSKDLYQRL
ncbi:MAG: M42 family metallopeptidase [Candidatus Thorarchaeota archaeon]